MGLYAPASDKKSERLRVDGRTVSKQAWIQRRGPGSGHRASDVSAGTLRYAVPSSRGPASFKLTGPYSATGRCPVKSVKRPGLECINRGTKEVHRASVSPVPLVLPSLTIQQISGRHGQPHEMAGVHAPAACSGCRLECRPQRPRTLSPLQQSVTPRCAADAAAGSDGKYTG